MEKLKLPLRLLFLMLLAATSTAMYAQQASITGTVSDPSGEPLVGVSVTVPGTKTGTTTDLDGMYSITADKSGKLQFSYIGTSSKYITDYLSMS